MNTQLRYQTSSLVRYIAIKRKKNGLLIPCQHNYNNLPEDYINDNVLINYNQSRMGYKPHRGRTCQLADKPQAATEFSINHIPMGSTRNLQQTIIPSRCFAWIIAMR